MNNLSSLAPPNVIYNIKHDQNYIKHMNGDRIIRSVFHNVQFDPIEDQKISEIQELCQEQHIQLPEEWSEADILKFCYTGDFVNSVILANIRKHIEWRRDPVMHTLTTDSEEFLKNGAVYQFGRDHQYRPIVYICITKVPTDINKLQPFLTALCVLLSVVKKHMCVPYYVERIRIIIDASGVSLFCLPFKVIKRIIEITELNFCASLESMFVLDPPMIFRAASKIVEQFIHPDTKARIKILCKSEYDQMQKYICESALQTMHGGNSTITQYWPIAVDCDTVYYSMHDHVEMVVPIAIEESQCQCSLM